MEAAEIGISSGDISFIQHTEVFLRTYCVPGFENVAMTITGVPALVELKGLHNLIKKMKEETSLWTIC